MRTINARFWMAISIKMTFKHGRGNTWSWQLVLWNGYNLNLNSNQQIAIKTTEYPWSLYISQYFVFASISRININEWDLV